MTTALSDREREVIALVVMGLGDGQVAVRLYLAENTVKTHLRRIYKKLGISGRVALCHWWYTQGSGTVAVPAALWRDVQAALERPNSGLAHRVGLQVSMFEQQRVRG